MTWELLAAQWRSPSLRGTEIRLAFTMNPGVWSMALSGCPVAAQAHILRKQDSGVRLGAYGGAWVYSQCSNNNPLL